MIYQIILIERSGRRVKKEHYNNLKSAEKKINKTYSTNKTYIITLPEKYEVGLVFCTANGQPYCQLKEETANAWIATRLTKNDEITFLKANFEDKLIKQILKYQENVENIKIFKEAEEQQIEQMEISLEK